MVLFDIWRFLVMACRLKRKKHISIIGIVIRGLLLGLSLACIAVIITVIQFLPEIRAEMAYEKYGYTEEFILTAIGTLDIKQASERVDGNIGNFILAVDKLTNQMHLITNDFLVNDYNRSRFEVVARGAIAMTYYIDAIDVDHLSFMNSLDYSGQFNEMDLSAFYYLRTFMSEKGCTIQTQYGSNEEMQKALDKISIEIPILESYLTGMGYSIYGTYSDVEDISNIENENVDNASGEDNSITEKLFSQNQYFNNGDIIVHSAGVWSTYSEEAGQDIWHYKIEFTANCRCAMNLYLHIFNDYKEHLNTQDLYEKIDSAGTYTLTGDIYGTKTYWYPEVYYIAISEYEYSYDGILYH